MMDKIKAILRSGDDAFIAATGYAFGAQKVAEYTAMVPTHLMYTRACMANSVVALDAVSDGAQTIKSQVSESAEFATAIVRELIQLLTDVSDVAMRSPSGYESYGPAVTRMNTVQTLLKCLPTTGMHARVLVTTMPLILRSSRTAQAYQQETDVVSMLARYGCKKHVPALSSEAIGQLASIGMHSANQFDNQAGCEEHMCACLCVLIVSTSVGVVMRIIISLR
jgi:hypothetical protein